MLGDSLKIKGVNGSTGRLRDKGGWRSSGPYWAWELLEVLAKDPRYKHKLKGVTQWKDVPLSDSSLLPRCSGFEEKVIGLAKLAYISSGTTGDPKFIFYTEEDWQESVAHRADCLRALGISSGVTACVFLPFGPWFTGDSVTEALLSIGAQVLPMGAYLPHIQGIQRLLKFMEPDIIVTTPTLALALVNPNTKLQKVKKLVLVGERLPRELRNNLKKYYSVSPVSIYAASESIIGYQCCIDEPDLYIWDPERLFLEVVDEQGNVKEFGTGELLVTRRYGRATPLLRYRLGDFVRLEKTPEGLPACRFIGRVGHAFSLASGVKISKAQLDRFLDELPGAVFKAKFRVQHLENGRDLLIITLFCYEEGFSEDVVVNSFKALSLEIADIIASGILVVKVEIVLSHGKPAVKRRLVIKEFPWKL